ncbi:hypothetical protein ACGFWI_08610 [Streptomyces sp. NPDC048434]|uniref:hypothetical protein n=1 Tax=Streptomyces sp. NPDC048434 TaxID=3365549 RepID=UPI0037213DE8
MTWAVRAPCSAHRLTRTAVLDNGHLVEQGSTGQLLANPQHPLTASLLQAAPDRGGAPGLAPPEAGAALRT